MTTYQYSNKGRRKTNQDFLLYKNTTEKPQIFICADGMGGYSHGEVASRVVSESILEFIEDNYHIYKPEQLIKEAVIYGNDSLMLKKLALGVGKMGTVITILMITGNTAYVSWLGDSRIYQYRNSQEIYRTEDHSIANELYKIHTLTAADVEKYASIVTASVMGDDTLKEIPVQKLGMEYIDYRKCMGGELPNEAERKHMAENNFQILYKLQDSYKTGIASLRDILSEN